MIETFFQNEIPFVNKCFSLPKVVSKLNHILSIDGVLLWKKFNIQFNSCFINLLEVNRNDSFREDKLKLLFFKQESLSILLSNSLFNVLAKETMEIVCPESFIISSDEFVQIDRYNNIGFLTKDIQKMFLCDKFFILLSKLK